MKQKILLLYTLLMISFSLSANTIEDNYKRDLSSLYEISRVNTNLGGIITYDSIIQLCDSLEKIARVKSDFDNVFKIQMIYVTTLCMKDDLGMAVTKSRSMYNEAMLHEHNLGIAYSSQAIGNTLLYSGQLKNAMSTIEEAVSKFIISKDSIHSVRALIHYMQLCNYDENAEKLYKTIELSKHILSSFNNKDDIGEKSDFMMLTMCYEVFYNLMVNNNNKAKNIIDSLYFYGADKKMTKRWKQYVEVKYYTNTGEYSKAIELADSILTSSENTLNLNQLRRMMVYKADLYEKLGEYEKACETYDTIFNLSKKMDKEGYTRQIETLHTNYVVDKIKIENIKAQNKLLTNVFIYFFVVLVIAGILLVVIFRRNKMSVKSKLELANIKNIAYNSIQSKSMFLSNMSHDLRTPLNAIVGFSDILSEDDELDEQTKEMCNDNIKQNSELLIKLFSDILDISSLQENNIKFTFEQCNVISLCNNVVNTVAKVNKSNAALFFENNIEEVMLVTDIVRLKQVLINLLVNATKFTEEGSIVLRLNFDKLKNEAVFMIEDTGCGIPIERQATIFERFEKLYESKQGVGLGLSICHLIVTKFGGKIWIDSEYDKGTRFIFTHPTEKQS